MTDLMCATEIWKIGVRGVGNVVLAHVNRGTYPCAKCGEMMSSKAGHRFNAQRFAPYKSGFWCRACVGKFILTETHWAYNPIMGILFPAHPMVTPIERVKLFDVWMAEGERGLFKFLTEAK